MEDQGTIAHSKVIINGQEWEPEEAQNLIELGNKTREYEQKWNTKLDTVWPEYGKLKETNRTMEQDLTQARSQLETFQAKKEAGTETPTDVKQAQEAARKLNIVLGDDLDQRGYIKKDELPQLFSSWQQEQDAIKSVLTNADKLETEINGEDGRPKFNKKVVLAYASAYKIPDLMTAYEDMHKDSLDAWKSAQVASKKVAGLKTLQPAGVKQPKQGKVDDSNVSDLLKEALGS